MHLGIVVFATAMFANGPDGASSAVAADRSPTQQASVPSQEVAAQYRLERLSRTALELADRVRSVMPLFPGVNLDETTLKKWAKYAVEHPDEKVRFRPSPDDAPNVVVSYQARFDDLEVVDLGLQRARPDLQFGPEPAVLDVGFGEVNARSRMELYFLVMENEGIVSAGSYVTASAELGTWKEFESRGLDEVAEWVVEYQYTLNRVVDGLEVVDSGIRLGVSRNGGLSGFRMTDISVERDAPMQPFAATLEDARRELRTYERGKHPEALVAVDQERVGLVLRPDLDVGVVPPGFLFNYSLVFSDANGDTTAVSRQKLGRVSFVDDAYDQVFPVVSTN
jgi:hypothetical protein